MWATAVRRDGCARTAHWVEREVLRSSRLHSDPLLASAPPISPRRIQVSVAEQDALGQRGHVAALGPATIGWLGLAIALVASSFVLPWRLEPASPVAVCLVLATFVVAEFYNLHIEFRRQTMSVSASELAFVVALIEIGPVWTALTRALAIAGFCIVQRLSLPKVVTNTAIAVVEVCVAVAVLRVLPVGVLSDPLTWVSYLVAIVLATLVGGALIRLAIIATQGYPGRALWTSMLLAAVAVTPMAVLVGLSALLLVEVTPWTLLLVMPLVGGLVLLYRRFAAVSREGQDLEKVYAFARQVAETRNRG